MSPDKGWFPLGRLLKIKHRGSSEFPAGVSSVAENQPDDPFSFKPLATVQTGIRLLDEERSIVGRPYEYDNLEVPSPELMKALHDFDDRIVHFDTGALNTRGSQEWDFAEEVAQPLAEQVFKDFLGVDSMPARGVACSLSGPLVHGDLLVRDIRQIVNIGSEQGRSVLTGGVNHQWGRPGLTEHVRMYLRSGPLRIKRGLPEELAKNVFPALLVFDRTKLHNFGDLSTDEKAKAILKAYIINF